jgi:threonine synthase
VQGETIHNLAIEGDFDDCQAMVKASFVAEPFLPDGRQLAAVNSINWARIMAQIVYYFYAALLLGAPDRAINFSVPDGQFRRYFCWVLSPLHGVAH